MSTQLNYEISITGTGVIKTRTISSENLKLDISNSDFVETLYYDGLNQYTIVVDISEDKATKDMIREKMNNLQADGFNEEDKAYFDSVLEGVMGN